MNTRRLLAILAHPDDESFGLGGTLARYAREGTQVHVCIVTDGAAGAVDQNALASESTPLAQLRRQELECACQVLGVTLHMLNYRDSGMAGSPDNQHPESLYQADLDTVAWELAGIICNLQPQVVITHDATGGYFHPDHIKVHQAVRRAWDQLHSGELSRRLGAEGYHAWQPQRLYASVIPRSALKWFIFIAWLRGQDPRHFGQNHDVDLTRVGVPDEQIQVRLDIGRYIQIKEKASACHRSQGGAGAQRWLPAFLRRRFMRYEFLAQLEPPGAGPHYDVFEGLENTSPF
ncbi:MAG: PIG-L family deacetylase [Anaerolineae bacterium]